MFPQKNRVTTQEFISVLNKGSQIQSEYVSLVYIKNNLYFKATIVVSKKISKLSHERNLQKRRLREAIKKSFQKKEPFKYSFIFFVKKNIKDVPMDSLIDDISALSTKIN